MALIDAIPAWVDRQMAALDQAPDWRPDPAVGMARLGVARTTTDAKRRRWAWSLAATTAVLLCLPAFSVTRTFAAKCVDACAGVTSTISRLFQPAPRPAEPARGVTPESERVLAPGFALDDDKGVSIDLASLRGRVVLVNFWATWCAPCKAEIPWFSSLQRTYGGRGLSVIGVSLDEDGWTSVRPFAASQNMNYPVAIGNDDIARAYGGVGSIPTTFIVDRHGRLAATHLGLTTMSEYEEEVAELLLEH